MLVKLPYEAEKDLMMRAADVLERWYLNRIWSHQIAGGSFAGREATRRSISFRSGPTTLRNRARISEIVAWQNHGSAGNQGAD
jgi:hypothetical protein